MKYSSIKNAFKKAKNENRPALLTYTVAGDNNKLNSLNILKVLGKLFQVNMKKVPLMVKLLRFKLLQPQCQEQLELETLVV